MAYVTCVSGGPPPRSGPSQLSEPHSRCVLLATFPATHTTLGCRTIHDSATGCWRVWAATEERCRIASRQSFGIRTCRGITDRRAHSQRSGVGSPQ